MMVKFPPRDGEARYSFALDHSRVHKIELKTQACTDDLHGGNRTLQEAAALSLILGIPITVKRETFGDVTYDATEVMCSSNVTKKE